MPRGIVFYPVLTSDNLNVLNCRIDNLKAFYEYGGSFCELTCNEESESRVVMISDDTGKWSPEENNFIIEGTLTVHNVNFIFDEGRLAAADCKIGIGLVWKSKASNMRGSQPIGYLTSDDGDVQFTFRKSFEASSLRGNVEVSFELYIIDNTYYQNCAVQGVILGQLQSVTFVVEGMGSVFSVFEKNAPGEPLWSMDCSWDEPEYSLFAESVRVTVNTAHPAWSLAESNDKVRKELLKEIMASSMQIIIKELDPEQYNGWADYEAGSVCDAVAYIVKHAEIDLASGATIAKSLRKYLDNILK